MASSTMTLSTSLGKIRGIVRDDCRVFLGVPFAHAGRFEYAVPTERLTDGPEAVFDATKPGPGCPQTVRCMNIWSIRRGTFTRRNTGKGTRSHTTKTA